MSDLKKRLQDLDRLGTPDLWARATSQRPGPETDDVVQGPPASKRVIAGVVAFAVFLAAGAFAWRAVRSGTSVHAASTLDPIDGTILWPERTGDELAATQAMADAGDPSVTWRLDPKEVATRFVEDVMGWGSPEGSYTVEIVYDHASPPAALVTIQRYAIPCPSPAPGDQSTCPPPYDGESINLEQDGVTGANGVWSIVSVRASELDLDLEPSDVIETTGVVSGHVRFPSTASAVPGFSAAAGATVGTQGSCSGTSGDTVQPGDISIGLPTYVVGQDSTVTDVIKTAVDCGSDLPGYVWIATFGPAHPLIIEGGVVDPFQSGGNDIIPSLFALTAVPMIVSTPSSPIPTVSPTPSPAASPPEPTSGPHGDVSTALVADGTLKCTATFPNATIDPGQWTGVAFSVQNVLGSPVTVRQGVNGDTGSLLISSAGVQVADTSQTHVGIIGPAPSEDRLPPGASAQIGAEDTPVLWSGLLQITPVCEGTKMSPVTLAVARPGAPSSAEDALHQALDGTREAFQTCMPSADGAWVTGTARATGGSNAPTLTFDARCSALVQELDGFDVVTLAIVAPPDAGPPDLSKLQADLRANPASEFAASEPIAVSWWVFVVTKDAMTKVGQHAVAFCQNSESFGSGVAVC